MQRWFRLLFWAAMAVTYVVAIWPKPLHVPGEPSDKVQHILAFVVLTSLAVAAYPRALVRIVAGLAIFGALIEATQSIPALHRDAELLDWIADVSAVVAIMLVVWASRRLRKT